MSELNLEQKPLEMDEPIYGAVLKNTKEIEVGDILTVTPTGLSAQLTEIKAGSLPSILGWSSTLVFSSTDADTVAWAAGSLILADGTTFAISAGNTGNMAAITYIYLDTAVSSTVLQTSTTASASVGANKILIAVAQNNAGSDATFQVFGGNGGILLKADNIAANSITANEIAANTITASQISADGIVGALIKTALTGNRTVLDTNNLRMYNGDTQEGFLRPDLTNNMVLGTLGSLFITDLAGEPNLEIKSDGSLYLATGGAKIHFASGREIFDDADDVGFKGNIRPSADDTYECGKSDRRWNALWAKTVVAYGSTAKFSCNGSDGITTERKVITDVYHYDHDGQTDLRQKYRTYTYKGGILIAESSESNELVLAKVWNG